MEIPQTQQMQHEQRNFFDDLNVSLDPGELLKQQKESEAKARAIDYLIHQTFEQNVSGKKLLEIWKESLIMQATVESGMDKFEAGIREGQKRMIRGIILTVKRIDRGKR
ncbi:MAG: hypothetical protein ACE5D7_01370 [Fidelibacterota bacterium]